MPPLPPTAASHAALWRPHTPAARTRTRPLLGAPLRRAGPFFPRRPLRHTRLYAAVFNEYLHMMITRGYAIEYFVEGGRRKNAPPRRRMPPRTGRFRFAPAAMCGTIRPRWKTM